MVELSTHARKPRPTIRAAVEWIAYNDEPSDRDVESVSDMISVVLAAELFTVAPEAIAKKVVAMRTRNDI